MCYRYAMRKRIRDSQPWIPRSIGTATACDHYDVSYNNCAVNRWCFLGRLCDEARVLVRFVTWRGDVFSDVWVIMMTSFIKLDTWHADVLWDDYVSRFMSKLWHIQDVGMFSRTSGPPLWCLSEHVSPDLRMFYGTTTSHRWRLVCTSHMTRRCLMRRLQKTWRCLAKHLEFLSRCSWRRPGEPSDVHVETSARRLSSSHSTHWCFL